MLSRFFINIKSDILYQIYFLFHQRNSCTYNLDIWLQYLDDYVILDLSTTQCLQLLYVIFFLSDTSFVTQYFDIKFLSGMFKYVYSHSSNASNAFACPDHIFGLNYKRLNLHSPSKVLP